MRLSFKHEDDVDGTPVGPVALVDDDGRATPRPFDPSREVVWLSITEARRFAAALGVLLVTS